MKNIRHEETSRDSLYRDMEKNLETIFQLWEDGDASLRFSVPLLCAVKLEAFINIAGKLNVKHWDILERKLSFPEKCAVVFSAVGLEFKSDVEPNKAAIHTFEIRNSLVHPKMKLEKIDEYISEEECERRRNEILWESHHLRSELTREKVVELKSTSDAFVKEWGLKLLEGIPEYWLNGGSTGSYTVQPIQD